MKKKEMRREIERLGKEVEDLKREICDLILRRDYETISYLKRRLDAQPPPIEMSFEDFKKKYGGG